MLPANQLESQPLAQKAGAVYAFTIGGVRKCDPPIVIAFRRPPEEVVAGWARLAAARTQGTTELVR